MSVLQYIRTNYRDYDDLSDDEVVRLWNKKFHPNQGMDEINEFYVDKMEQDRQDEFGMLGTFQRGMSRGLDKTYDLFMNGGLKGLLEYASGNEEGAAKSFERYDKALRENTYLGTDQKIPPVINYNQIDGEGFLDKMTPTSLKQLEDVADFGLGAVGEFIPDLAGAGIMSIAGKKAVQSTAKAITKDLTQKQLDNLGRLGSKYGRMSYFGAQNFGEVYNEVYRETDGNPDMMKVLIHGAINTKLDDILPGHILDKLSTGGRDALTDYAFRRLMKGIGKGALIEGGTEATQQLSVELAKTGGWNYLENISDVDLKAIEEAFAHGMFGGGPVRGAIDLATGINPTEAARRDRQKNLAELNANLSTIEKGGGLAEPTIPVEPTYEETVKPERSRSKYNIRDKKDKTDKRIFELTEDKETTRGETWDSYVKRISESKKLKADELKKQNDAVKGKNKELKKEYENQLKSFDELQKLRGTETFQAAKTFVNNRLQNLRDKGEQGLKIADALESQVTNGDVKAVDLVTAFNSADVLNQILPQSADLTVEFLKSITHEDGAAQGIYNSSSKLLALAYDVGANEAFVNTRGVEGVRALHEKTASHEAFHVLQDYFNAYDKGAKAILEETFGSQGKAVDYNKSPIRKWLKRIDPQMDQDLVAFSNRPPKNLSEESGQIENSQGQGILGSELQAYAFSVYAKARKEGRTPVMQSGLARYFNFLYRFLNRMGNALKGYGFRDAQDIFEQTSKGEFAKSFIGKGVAGQVTDGNQASAMYAIKRQIDALKRGVEPVYYRDREYTRPISVEDVKAMDTRLTLGKERTGVQVPLEKGGQKVDIKMKVGINGFMKDDGGKSEGFGFKHIKDMHGFEIEQLGYKQIAPFVRDTLIYGTPKKDKKLNPNSNDSWVFKHKPPNSKPRTAIVFKRDDGYFVHTAFVGENSFKTQRSSQATQEDVERYRNSRASALNPSPDRISTRLPKIWTQRNKDGVLNNEDDIAQKRGEYENPYLGELVVGFDVIMNDPKLVARFGDFFRNIVSKERKKKNPNDVETYTIFTKEQLELPDDQLIEAFIETAKKNLLFIYDGVKPQIRVRSKKWYDGANRISRDLGDQHNIEFQRAAGVLAALSPKLDWFQNISLAERTIDVYMNNRDTKVTDEMLKKLSTLESFNEPKYKKEVAYIRKHKPSIKDVQDLATIKANNLDGASPSIMKAMLVRLYDETYNSRDFSIVTPEGEKVGFQRKKNGDPVRVSWQSFTNIAKGIDVLEADSKTLIRSISQSMGNAHKVRNFYNNIVDPNGTMGDVTIDTHAIGASFFRPMAATTLEVNHGLNGANGTHKDYSGAPRSDPLGSYGTYPLLAEAHRRAANERGVLPREMQSITWEAVREIFTDTFKNDNKNKETIKGFWKEYQDGKYSLEETQRRVLDESVKQGFGFKDPSWASESNITDTSREGSTDNTSQLSALPLRSEPSQAIGTDGRGLGRDPQRVLGRDPQSRPERGIDEDPFTQASALPLGKPVSVITDDFMMRVANKEDGMSFKTLVKGQFKGGFGLNETQTPKIFENRKLKDGTKVLLRPNLNAWIFEPTKGQPPIVTQTVHKPGGKRSDDLTENSYKKGVYGYDKIASVKGQVDLDVVQSAREEIASGVKAKLPMAGGYGELNQISEQEMLEIINNPDHVLAFDPKKFHLFYSRGYSPNAVLNESDVETDANGKVILYDKLDKDGNVVGQEPKSLGHSVKGYRGVGVHYNTSVYVKGELDYWKADEAPMPLGGIGSENTFKSDIVGVPKERDQASNLSYATSFDQVIANSQSDTFINKFLHSLKNFTPKAFGRAFITEVIDSYHPIRLVEENLVEKQTGIRGLRDGVNSAYKFIEMQGNVAGRREIVLKRGAPVLINDGEITIKDGTKGLMEVLGQIESETELREFTEYAYAKRAASLKERERLIGPDLIRQGLARENEKFKKMFDDIQDFQQGMLDFLVQSGLITQKERINLGKYDYIPFYREIQDEFDKRTGTNKKKDILGPEVTSSVLNNPSAKLQKYKGGTAPIGNIIDNLIRNASVFIDQGMKNVAMQKTTNLFREAGVGKDLKVRPNPAGSVNYVTYKVNGRNKYYDVEDPLLYASLASLAPRQVSGILGAMETVARYFREFITHQPAFMLANYMRGEMAGFVTVDAKVTPIADSLKGFMNSLRNSESIEEMKLNAGVGGYTFGDTPRDSAKGFMRDLRFRNRDYTIVNSPQALIDLSTKMWGGLTKVGEASELAYRDGVYRTLREQGKSKSEAAYEALNVINFNRKGAMRTGIGSTLGALIPLVPFLNARIQGLYRTFDPMVTGRQANRKKVILYGTMLTMASLALYSESAEDERYEQEPLHLKLNYHIFYVGDKRYLIPRAFEVGAIFTTLPEFIMESIKKGEGDELQKATLMTLLNTFSLNPTPQAIKPIIEVATNYDMFRQSYIDSPFESNYKPSARYGAGTSETAKMLSEKTEGIFGMSPNQITKLITGYLGSMGTTLLTAFDVAISRGDSSPPRPLGVFGDGVIGLATEATGFGRFVKDETYAGNKFIQNFYETKEQVDQIYNSMMRFRKDGQLDRAEKILEGNRRLIGFRDSLNKINASLQKINREIRRVKTHPDMSPEDKRERLIMLLNNRNRVARNFDRMYQRIKKAEK